MINGESGGGTARKLNLCFDVDVLKLTVSRSATDFQVVRAYKQTRDYFNKLGSGCERINLAGWSGGLIVI